MIASATIPAGPSLSGAVASVARPAESRLAIALRASGSTAVTEALMRPVAVYLAAASATSGLSNRKIRRFALGGLTIGSGQGCTNQSAMDRAVVIARLRSSQRQGIGINFLGRRLERRCRDRRLRGVFYRFDGVGIEFGTQRAFHGLTGSTFGALSTLWRNTCPFEFMLRIAGSAARLLDLIFDHRHDGMVGDAAFTRAVIVQNVTEPKPALLH